MALNLSDRELAKEFGVSPQVLGRRFKESEIKTGRGVKHTIKEAHEALAKVSNVRQATEQARLKNLLEDGQIKELERRQKERELVPLSEAIDITTKPWSPIARMLKDMPARLSGSCNPTDPVLAKEVLDEYVQDLCTSIGEAMEKLKQTAK